MSWKSERNGRIPTRLKMRRKQKNLSREEVAARAGISLSGYLDLEAGRWYPRLDTAYRLAPVLAAAVDELWPDD